MKRRGKNISSYRWNIDVTNYMIFVVLRFMHKLKLSIVLVWKLDLKSKVARKGESPFCRGGWPHDPIGLQAASRTGAAGKLKCHSLTAVLGKLDILSGNENLETFSSSYPFMKTAELSLGEAESLPC